MGKAQPFCGGACRGFFVVGFLCNRIANLCPFFRLDKLSFESLMPFEQLIRAASLEEQFALHQSLNYTRRGFLEETF
jgi:hypothetical protein